MSNRINKINKHIQRILAEILQKNIDLPPDVLVTVSKVNASPNLQSATVWLYIMPLNREEEVLELLKSEMYFIQGEFNRQVHLKHMPRIAFAVDKGANHADKINKKLSEIK